MSSEFKRTGSPELRADAARADMSYFREPKDRLRDMVAAEVAAKPFSELTSITYDHEGSELAGHVLLDALEEEGFGLDDFDAVGALTAAAIPLACAMLHAAASRGQDLDAFVMDFVYPSIKGPSIKGKRVILLDAWLSEKSYVQTSSLVTLRHGNELSLDFSIVENEGASVAAVAALVGGVDSAQGERPVVHVVDTVTDAASDLPFVEVFHESDLRAEAGSAGSADSADSADSDDQSTK